MRGYVRAAVSLGVIVALVFSATVAQAAKDGKGKKKDPDGTKNRAFVVPKEITLTSDQQVKLDEIKKEQAPKIVELTKKFEAVLTDEQKATRKDAMAKARADGKKGKAVAVAADEALSLTDEQKKQRSEAQTELTTLQQSIKEQVYAFLTDEQKPHYKLPKAKKAA